MKFKTLSLLLLLAGAAGLQPLFAQAPTKSVSVTILQLDANGQNPIRRIGFIRDTNDKGILFAYSQADPAGVGLPHAQVKGVSFTDENEIMSAARYAYSRQSFAEAEAAFKKIADEYEFLWGITREQFGNFASESRFFQIDCLRRLGRYSEIAPALQTKTGLTLDKTINEVYLPTLKLIDLWKQLAAQDWKSLQASLKEYEVPLDSKKAELLTGANFKAVGPAILVQLHYLRGKLFESQGNKEEALRDYYRCMTLSYGSDKLLTQDAMKASLAIQAAEPGLDQSYPLQTEINALAVVYKDIYNDGKIESAYTKFVKTPEMPEAIKQQVEAQKAAEAKAKEEAKAAEAAAKPATPAAGAKPATPATPEAKPAPKK